MNTRVLLVALVLSFFSLTDTFAQSVERGPYLQKVTTNSIYIHWRTSSSTASKVWYGTSANNLNMTENVSGSRTDHEVQLTGLQTNTTYYYAVGYGSQQLEGGGNDPDFYFNTAPPSNTNQTIRAWVLGNAGHHNGDQQDVRDAYYNYNNGDHIDLMLLLGDNAYDDGSDAEYQDAWFTSTYGYPDRLRNSVMWSTYGNREEGTANGEDELGPYFDIFNFPAGGEAGGVASGKEAYYSFNYGNIHFISLNAYEMDDDDSYRANMLAWLQNDIDNGNDLEWTVAFFHYPPYAYSDGPVSDSHDKEKPVRELILPILEGGGVDLVLSSHHHSYQRSTFIHGHYGTSNTFNNSMQVDDGSGREGAGQDGAYTKEIGGEGTVYMIAGSAGNSSGSNPSGHPVQYTAVQGLGSVEFEVTGLTMDVNFIEDDGSIGDYFSIIKTPNGTPSVAITNPANDDFYPMPQPVTITADASDPDGTISQVEFFIDDVSIGTDNSSPYTKSWTASGNGSFEIKAVATDNDNLTATSSIVTVHVGDVVTSSQVGDDDDDAEEIVLDGEVDVNSSDLEMTLDGSDVQTIGMRFNNINIPQGATIVDAYIQFTADETDAVATNLQFYAEKSINPAIFDDDDFNISSRTKTAAFKSWSLDEWENEEDAGAAQKTPDLSTVIQEVVNQPGFSTNSSIVILVEGTGKRVAKSGQAQSGAPILSVTYNFLPPLPVELIDITTKAEDKGIRLDWSTATEIDNDYFTIERSTDARDFQAIGTVPGNGNTTEISHYDFLDRNPADGVNYYRLKQTDFDGEFAYSKIVNASYENNDDIRLFPTMVKNLLTIQRSGTNISESSIIVHDLTGRSFKNTMMENGETSKEINLQDLVSGVYFVSIYNKEAVETFKIVKL